MAMTAETMEKPAYLGLLNAISLGESAAGIYLEAWANVTTNEDLACTLRLVAARERSHGERHPHGCVSCDAGERCAA